MKKKKRLLRITIGILLCICMSVGIVPKTASADTVTHVNTYLDSFEQFTADYYLTYSSLDFYLENGVPYHTYITNTEEDFEETLATWRIATMGADDVTSYSQEEVDFYILLIYDVIYQKMHNESGLQNFNTQADAMLVSTLSELGKDVGEELVKLTPDLNVMDENWESVLNTIVNTETFSALMNYSDTILKCVDFAGSVEDLIDKLSMMKEFIDCSEEIDLVLTDLYKNANDAQLKEAIRQIRTMATGLLSENEIIAIFGGDLIAGEAKEFALNKLWSVVTSSNAVMAGATIGSKVGKLACNYLFGTDAVVENWYSMDKIYTFEKVLKSQLLNYKAQFEANPTFNNAIIFNQAADMYLNTISTGMEYAIKYVESAKGGGFLGWIYKNFTNEEEYNSLITTLNQIKTNIDLDIEFINNDTYNYYLESVDAENLYNVAWEETSCEITEADIEANLEENEDGMFMLSDQTVVADTAYSEDMITYANYYHESGTLDLAGQTLTVYGDFYLNGGTVKLNGGVLDVRGDLYFSSDIMNLSGGVLDVGGSVYQSGGKMLIEKGQLRIDGDYRIQSQATNSEGKKYYTYSTGILQMKYAEDQVCVGGSYITQSTEGTGASVNLLDAGIMEVGGDFIQLKGKSSSLNSVKAVYTHKLVLNGTGEQRVSFEQSTCFLGTLEIADTSEVTMSGYLSIAGLQNNAEVKSDGLILNNIGVNGHNGEINTIGLNSNTLKITGDVTAIGTINLYRGKLYIDGDLLQPSGIVVLNKGILEVSGDYRIQSQATNSEGDKYYTYSTGVLQMKYAEDKVCVGESYITQSTEGTGSSANLLDAGIMEVGGDFIQLKGKSSSLNSVKAGYTHKLVLNGTGEQRVSFEQSTCFLGMLEIADTSEVTMSGYLYIAGLQNNAKVKSDGLILNNLGVNGHNGKTNTIGLNSNTLEITGNVTTIGTINIYKGNLCINGDLLQPSGSVVLNEGILEIKGDYRIQSQSTNSDGEIIWGASSGILSMTYDLGQLHIGGGFYTASTQSHSGHLSAGTMYIKGDFYQGANNANNFKASGTHHVILNGSNLQTVTFVSTNSYFNYLHITQPKDCYSFSRDVCWNYLHSELTCTTTEPTCTEQGYSTYTCQFCGTSYQDGFTDALGHKYEDGICVTCGKEEYITIATGYSGNLIWSLMDNGALVFSGKGSMRNYTYKSEMPWYSYINDIKKIVLEHGVTTIGNYAFYGMPNLTTIEIPDSVAIVGDYAFKNSTALDNVTLPSTLIRLGDSAFYGCASLTSIDIPESLYTIRAYTFKNCTSLASVTFHEGNLQKISDAAFYNTGLTEVTLPDCLDILDVYVFKNCSKLTHIKLGNGLTEIREASLYGTAISYIEVPEGITKIGSYAFKNCTNLAGISLPATLASVGEASFYACTALEELALPDAVATIGNYAFRKCEKLAAVDFSENLENIGESSFYGCTALTALVIPEKVTEIQSYAFKGCIGLTAVSLPDSLVTLGESVFYGCTGLGNIVVPVNVAAVGAYAFSRCSGLTEIQFTGNAPSIGSGAFSKVTASVYYPADKTGWTAEVMQDYGGTITWTAK